MSRRTVQCLLPLLPVPAGTCWAQRDTGTIDGTAMDGTGSVVPALAITFVDAPTGTVVFITRTGEPGRYRAPVLIPGTYTVTAERSGFKKAIRSGIPLDVGRIADVDLALEVGQVSEVLEVTGAAPLIRVESAEILPARERRRPATGEMTV